MTGKQFIDYQAQDAVALIRLNCPESLNALSRKMVRQLNHIVPRFNADDNLRCAVILSSGDIFSAGFELKDVKATLHELKTDNIQEVSGQFSVDFEDNEFHEKPIIAAIHGKCYGAGLTLCMACDMRIASYDALFCLPEVKLGLGSVTGTLRCAQNMGLGNALELLLLAEPRDAQWAQRTGLVNCLVAPDELEKSAINWANTIASMSFAAISGTRKVAQAAVYGQSFNDVCKLGHELRKACRIDDDYMSSITESKYHTNHEKTSPA
jgi:E-phenylitaconyl-CoA hydratase